MDHKFFEHMAAWVVNGDPKMLLIVVVVLLLSCVVTATRLALASRGRL